MTYVVTRGGMMFPESKGLVRAFDEKEKPWAVYSILFCDPPLTGPLGIGRVIMDSIDLLDLQYSENEPLLGKLDPQEVIRFETTRQAVGYILINRPGCTKEELEEQLLQDFPKLMRRQGELSGSAQSQAKYTKVNQMSKARQDFEADLRNWKAFGS